MQLKLAFAGEKYLCLDFVHLENRIMRIKQAFLVALLPLTDLTGHVDILAFVRWS